MTINERSATHGLTRGGTFSLRWLSASPIKLKLLWTEFKSSSNSSKW